MPRPLRSLGGPIDAHVSVPGSKSIANRALVCAALADGVSTLGRVPGGDDTAAMVDCLRLLGVDVGVADHSMEVHGSGARLPLGPVTLPARLAGTTSRFVTALAALGPGPYTVDGLAPLRARPMGPLHVALRELGVTVDSTERDGHLPVVVAGPPRADHAVLSLPGDVSSQYVTALMLIAPLLAGGLRLRLTTALVSRPYVELTAAVMAAFGAPRPAVGDRTVTVMPGRYSPCTYPIEPDASSASYPLAAAAVCGGRVVVDGLHRDALQGDVAIVDLLARMGCTTRDTGDGLELRSDGRLVGIDVDMADVSDLVPTIAAVAAFATTPTTIRGVGFIRRKESDRIGDLCTELRRAGIDAIELDDGLHIAPGTPHGAQLQAHHDHRLAMAFAIVALRVPGIVLDDPDVVSKSWPEFWSMIDAL